MFQTWHLHFRQQDDGKGEHCPKMLHPGGQNLVTHTHPAAIEAGDCPTKSPVSEEENEKKYWDITNLCLGICNMGVSTAKYYEYMRHSNR